MEDAAEILRTDPRIAADAGRTGINQTAIVLQRQQDEARLRDADRRKDQFLAMLAHELRHPLAPIRNAPYLTVMLPPDPVRREADPGRLAQVITHLLNNAAKYTEPGSSIALEE